MCWEGNDADQTAEAMRTAADLLEKYIQVL
jgi:hypothetical protein